jgi:hypothetical protein
LLIGFNHAVEGGGCHVSVTRPSLLPRISGADLDPLLKIFTAGFPGGRCHAACVNKRDRQRDVVRRR